MDSSGLGRLVEQARKCHSARVPFGLLEPATPVRRLIDGLHLSAQLPVYASVRTFHAETQAPFSMGPAITWVQQKIQVAVTGVIDYHSADGIAGNLRGQIEDLTPGSSLRLDCREVRFLDSYGLGRLLHVKKQADRRQIDFALKNVEGTPLKVLRMVALDRILLASDEFSPKA